MGTYTHNERLNDTSREGPLRDSWLHGGQTGLATTINSTSIDDAGTQISQPTTFPHNDISAFAVAHKRNTKLINRRKLRKNVSGDFQQVSFRMTISRNCFILQKQLQK